MVPGGKEITLQVGYVPGYPNPALTLEGRAIGAFVDTSDADAFMDFIFATARLDPANISRAEP